ncbi:MAG: SCO family protein [Gemmataceae bacterium]
MIKACEFSASGARKPPDIGIHSSGGLRPPLALLLMPIGLILCIVVAGCNCSRTGSAGETQEDLDLGPLPDFKLTASDGQQVSKEDFRGKLWVASFIFTRCTGECPQVTGTMARLQKELADQKDVRLVSISVDPEHDTPKVLKAYADSFRADPNVWLFLTGDKDKVYQLIFDGFHLGVDQATGSDRKPGREVTHSSRLMVVDRRGHVRGMFEGLAVDLQGKPVDDVPQVRKRLEQLRREQP